MRTVPRAGHTPQPRAGFCAPCFQQLRTRRGPFSEGVPVVPAINRACYPAQALRQPFNLRGRGFFYKGIMMENIEPELIDTRQLATLLSVSTKFIEKHRQHIAGSMKIGGAWRFRLSDIRSRIATGRDIVVKNGK